MNRRESLIRLMAASGAVVALPAWADDWSTSDVQLFRSSFGPSEQSLLAAVADTIIPAGNGIGAISVGVDKYLEKLIDKCYEPSVGNNVKVQLVALDSSSQTAYGKSFTDCDQPTRESLLLKFSQSSDPQQQEFFKLMKSETIRGFNTSKEVQTKYLGYKMAPGHYYGCVDVKTS
jgi:hypothetical protein